MSFYKILLTLATFVLFSCGGAEERKAVYLEKARLSIESGNLEKARVELKNVLQIDPKDSEAYFHLGKVYEQLNEYRKAYENYLKVESINPELLENQARLGRIYLLLANEPDKAQQKIDFILAKEPDNAEGLLLKAAVMLRNRKTDEAIKIAKGIIARNSTHIESVAFLASLQMRNNEISEAIALLDTALQSNRNNEKLNRLLALALVADKNYERAEMLFKDFVKRNPDNTTGYNNLAAFYKQINDIAKAEKTLRASIDNKATDEKRILTLIKFIKDSRNTDAAIKELELFVETRSRPGKLQISLAELFIINGDKESAVKILKRVINNFSEDATGVSARIMLAALYLSQDDVDRAAEVIDDAISVSPNDPDVNFLRAKISVSNSDMETAIISLRIVTKEMPENIEAFFLLANIYQLEGNVEQAKNTLTRAYEKNRTNAAVLLRLAQHYLARDVNLAEKIIDHYNTIKGKNYDGLLIKSDILNQRKKHAEAYEMAKTLIDYFPDKPGGYLQAMPYYGVTNDKKSAVSLLEEGYLATSDNRRLLLLLTAFQVEDKKFDLVVNRIKMELDSSVDDIDLKILLAKVYMVKNNADAAEVLLVEAIAIKPSIEEPYLLLSQIYQSKKDFHAVQAILVEGSENIASSVKILLRLASSYEKEGAYKKAIDVYRGLYQSHPENLIIVNNLASLLSDHGNNKNDLKEAKALVEKLKKSDQPVFLDTIGWVYYKRGNYVKAINYLTQVVDKMPEVNIFNYHLGMAYKLSGDKMQAKTYLKKSLADNKQFKEKELAAAALTNIN